MRGFRRSNSENKIARWLYISSATLRVCHITSHSLILILWKNPKELSAKDKLKAIDFFINLMVLKRTVFSIRQLSYTSSLLPLSMSDYLLTRSSASFLHFPSLWLLYEVALIKFSFRHLLFTEVHDKDLCDFRVTCNDVKAGKNHEQRECLWHCLWWISLNEKRKKWQ